MLSTERCSGLAPAHVENVGRYCCSRALTHSFGPSTRPPKSQCSYAICTERQNQPSCRTRGQLVACKAGPSGRKINEAAAAPVPQSQEESVSLPATTDLPICFDYSLHRCSKTGWHGAGGTGDCSPGNQDGARQERWQAYEGKHASCTQPVTLSCPLLLPSTQSSVLLLIKEYKQ